MRKQRKTRKAGTQAVLAEVKNLAVMGAGITLGALGGRMVDKALKTDSATGPQALLRPVLMTGLGAYGAATLKNPMARLLAAGIGASGILAGVKALTKADVLAGMAPSFARVELGERGSFYRIQAGPLPSRDAARGACERLSKAGTVCFVVPPA